MTAWGNVHMTDQGLRGFERRRKETGDMEDEADLLRERVRVGELSERKVKLAAYCGHTAARVLFPLLGCRRLPSGEVVEDSFTGWLQGLSEGRWGREVLLRAAIAVAWEHLHLRDRRGSKTGKREARQQIEAAEQWLVCPCDRHSEEWWAAVETSEARLAELATAEHQEGPCEHEIEPDEFCELCHDEVLATEHELDWVPKPDSKTPERQRHAEIRLGGGKSRQCREAIRREISAYALYSDPVAERVTARGQG
jgi:hypothetical protein